METPPSHSDSSEQSESLWSMTPDSLDNQTTRAIAPEVEDLSRDMGEDSHSISLYLHNTAFMKIRELSINMG